MTPPKSDELREAQSPDERLVELFTLVYNAATPRSREELHLSISALVAVYIVACTNACNDPARLHEMVYGGIASHWEVAQQLAAHIRKIGSPLPRKGSVQ